MGESVPKSLCSAVTNYREQDLQMDLSRRIDMLLALCFLGLTLLAAPVWAQCENQPDDLSLKCLNPTATKALIHHDYNPYGPNPEPAKFKLYDIQEGKLLHTFEILNHGRFVSWIKWLDDRWALILGEGIYYAILDTQEMKVSAKFLAQDLTISPTEHYRMAFELVQMPLYKIYDAPERTDRVGVGWLAKEASKNQNGNRVWRSWQVYPELLSIDGWAEDPTQAQFQVLHEVVTPLRWSPEGDRVAFVDESETGTFLVVVTPPGGEADEPQVERFPLPEPETSQEGSPQETERKVEGLSWGAQGKSIRVKTSSGEYEICLAECGT